MKNSFNNFPLSLSLTRQWMLGLFAFFFVAFGQPAWLPWNGMISAAFGFALLFRVLLSFPFGRQRFYVASLWFCAVQLVQLSWFVSHPYWYIYAVYFLLCVGMGMQFGIIALFIRPEKFKNQHLSTTLIHFLPIAALWTLFEWCRLFVFSGFSWNPIGIAMTSNLYALQMASIAGIFGISFWMILVNLLAVWVWVQKKILPFTLWICAAVMPYAYGAVQMAAHREAIQERQPNLTAILVQTAFAAEEAQEHSGKRNLIEETTHQWSKIFQMTKKHQGQEVHLIVLPEFVVPFGTYSDVYPLIEVKKTLFEITGKTSLSFLPSLGHPFASLQQTVNGPQWFVNNAYWTQALANYFQADVLIGLEDAEDIPSGTREYYSAAIFIRPQTTGTPQKFEAERYSKQVLVPMGEYIPFEACKKLAEKYGVFGSFTCGKEAAVMSSHGISFSPSICYEETFGHIMREGRQKGADLFVNLTSDVWYPDSKLPKQHLDHARLRTVENGVPLIRACNTGITAAIDSFGKDLAVLGGNDPEKVEWISDSLLVNIPVYTYHTLYSRLGDFLMIGLSVSILLLSAAFRKGI